MNRVVVRYHEIALKRGNRPAFVRQLVDNVGRGLRGTGVRRVRSAAGRLVVKLGRDADCAEISRRLRDVFGVANYSLSWRSERSLDAITATALEIVEGRRFASFAVRTKRGDKSFPIPSPEISRHVGAAIRAHTAAAVDLESPELVVHIEVIPHEAFVSLDRLPGPGGLPVGASGTVMALLSGGIDSPVAAWRMMRRGCRAELVHFHGAPYQDRSSRDKVLELARVLTRFQFDTRVHLVAFGEVQREIVARVRRPLRVVLYRRMMMRIAATLAARVGAAALVTGESLGQVASQTLPNLAVTEQAAGVPVLRPLIGMDKAEITAQAQRIGTYDISIQPDQDCCQLFVPRHPATRTTLDEVGSAEAALDIGALVHHGLDHVSVEQFEYPPARELRPPRASIDPASPLSA